jgi:hypothetical protein
MPTISLLAADRASYHDIGVRFVAANTHPDHDTIAVFQRTNKAAFVQVLLLAREEWSAARGPRVDRRHQD